MKIYIEQDDVKLSFERAQELNYQTLFNTSFVSTFFPFWRVGIPCRKFS